MSGLVVQRAADRLVTTAAAIETRHAFSSGRHYDPANTSFGLLVAHDEHVVGPGAGFPLHLHRDVEIVTWVLSGALRHSDSAGHVAVVRPGVVQRLSAGSGVEHAEVNHGVEPLRFVQMWLLPDELGGPPEREERDVEQALAAGTLVPLLLGLRNRHAALHAARLPPGAAVDLPDAPLAHVFVARGAVDLPGAGPLGAGDAVRLTTAGGRRLTATADAEVLVWEMHATAGR